MANKIKILRKINNISQSELAREVKVTRTTISSIENGSRQPTLKLAFKIARYFKVSVEDLFELKPGNRGGMT